MGRVKDPGVIIHRDRHSVVESHKFALSDCGWSRSRDTRFDPAVSPTLKMREVTVAEINRATNNENTACNNTLKLNK